jgi:hypothetical protein
MEKTFLLRPGVHDQNHPFVPNWIQQQLSPRTYAKGVEAESPGLSRLRFYPGNRRKANKSTPTGLRRAYDRIATTPLGLMVWVLRSLGRPASGPTQGFYEVVKSTGNFFSFFQFISFSIRFSLGCRPEDRATAGKQLERRAVRRARHAVSARNPCHVSGFLLVGPCDKSIREWKLSKGHPRVTFRAVRRAERASIRAGQLWTDHP